MKLTIPILDFLLPRCSERQQYHRAAKRYDELASPHHCPRLRSNIVAAMIAAKSNLN
jgi:hypothetical protein